MDLAKTMNDLSKDLKSHNRSSFLGLTLRVHDELVERLVADHIFKLDDHPRIIFDVPIGHDPSVFWDSLVLRFRD